MGTVNRYLRETASQDVRRLLAQCFVLTPDRKKIAAYYTLSQSSVEPESLPVAVGRRLPRRRPVPATLIGQLGVDLRYRRQHFGDLLMANAVERTLRVGAEVPSCVMIVDAVASAVDFYRRFGFEPLPGMPGRLFLVLSRKGL